MFPVGKFRADRHISSYLRLDAVAPLYRQLPHFLIISAPAGYGKSSLAQDLLRHHDSESKSSIWLSLDDRDAEVGRFLSLLAVGLAKLLNVDEETSASTEPYYKSDAGLLTDTCVRRLNLIESEKSPFVLVLDDYHEVQSDILNKAFNSLLAYWPANLTLVVTCRTNCTLKLAKYALSGGCERVDLDKLKFSKAHICDLAAEQQQPQVSEEWLAQVMDITEGWPVAVQLACYQLRHGAQIALDDVKYHSDIAEFFWEQIFDELPEVQKSLLIACSIVERFDASLLVHITEDADTPVLLNQLLSSNLFLQKAKDQSHWYRVHSTLRTLLQGQFVLWNHKKQQAYVLRAIHWCSEQGYMDEALYLCQRHGLWNMVAGILRDKGEEYVSVGSFEFLHYWFEKLADDLIASDPVLILYHVWSMPEYRQIHTGNLWLDRAEEIIEPVLALKEENQAVIDSQRVLSQVLALRGYVARISGCYDDAVTYSEAAVELSAKVHPAMLSRLYMTLGQDYYLRGDLLASEVAIQKSIQLGKQYSQSHNVLIALGYLIATLALSGRFRDALAQYEQCKEWFCKTGFTDLPQAGLLSDLANDLYREMGDFELAKQGVDDTQKFCKVAPVGLPHLVSNIRSFRLAVALNDQNLANNALMEAELFKRLLGVSWSFGWAPVEAMRAQYEIRWGKLVDADEWFLPRAELLFETDEFAHECEQFIYVEWLIAKKSADQAKRLLDRMACHAIANKRVLHLMKVKIAQALLLESADPVQSELLLMESLKCAGDEVILGPFLEAGQGIVPILARVKVRMYQDFDALKLLERLNTAALTLWPTSDVALDSSRLKTLSKRQMTILGLLVEGAQDKAIARALDISPGTVKTHLRAIYRKLECNNRSLAVSIALEEGIQFLASKEQQAS
ncbi:hypothetical protein A9Q99_09770 [Gammaproteobacteria bacterium 45_16_T64]|nr:hypothetical protein A9Q99_09770 [Gammaproteobacteria bacterium 45_16_T64]